MVALDLVILEVATALFLDLPRFFVFGMVEPSGAWVKQVSQTRQVINSNLCNGSIVSNRNAVNKDIIIYIDRKCE